MKPKPTVKPEPGTDDLGRAAIDAIEDAAIVPVHVPEWGGTVHLRTLSGTELDAFERSQVRETGRNEQGVPVYGVDLENVRAKLLVMCLCDRDGRRLYRDDEARVLGQRAGRVLDRLYDRARALNGIATAAEDAKVKNSASAR